MQQTINRSRFTQVPQGTHVIEILDDEEEKILMNDDQLDAIKQELIAQAIFTKNLDEMKKAIFYCCARKTVGDKKAFEKTMNLKYVDYFKQKLNIDISKEFYKGKTEVDDKSSQPDSHHIVLYGADFLTTKNLQTKFKGFHEVQIEWINASNVSIKFNPEQNVQNLLSIERKNDQKINKNQIVEQLIENNQFKWIPLKKYEVLGFQRPLWYRHASKTETFFPEEHFDGKKFQRAKITIQESELFITCDKDKEFYDKNIVLFQQSLYTNRKYRKSMKGSQNGQRINRQRTRDFRNKGRAQDFQQRKNDDQLSHRYDRRHSNNRNDNNFYPYENDRHNKRQYDGGNRNRAYSDANKKRNQENGSFTQRKNDRRDDFNNRRDNFENTRNNFSNRHDNHDRTNNFSRTNYGGQSNNRDNGGRRNNLINQPNNVQKSMEIEDKSFQFQRRSMSKSRSNSSKSFERHPNLQSLINQENNVSLSFAINQNAANEILNNTQNQEVTMSFINHSNSLNRKEEQEQSEKSEDLQNLLSKLEENKKYIVSLNNKSRSNSSRSNSSKGKKPQRKNSSVQKQKSVGRKLHKTRGNRYNSSEERTNNQNDQNRGHNNQFYNRGNDSNRNGNYNRGRNNNQGERDHNNHGRQYNNNERQNNNYGDRQYNYKDRNYNNQNSDSRGNSNLNTERNNDEENNTSNRGRGSYMNRGTGNYQKRSQNDNQNNRDGNSNNRDFRSNDNNYSRGFGGNRQDFPRKDGNYDPEYQNQPSRGYNQSNRDNFPSSQSSAFKKPPVDIEPQIQY